MKKTLKSRFGRQTQIFKVCIGIHLTRPIDVRKQVELNIIYFLTFPGGWVGVWSELKLKLTQFNFNLNCLFELSLAKLEISFSLSCSVALFVMDQADMLTTRTSVLFACILLGIQASTSLNQCISWV